ncbi:helix-turn-helix domain-containing protein [Streptomyces mexicanus]|uniref:helix-turn-helix domain-containing protein n=1 Tax=Streptomyces mexicanus TaxID=178566 RepID=UPI0036532C03
MHDHPAELIAYRRRVGDRLREQRRAAGLSQQALAERVGLDKQAISKIENAHQSPRLDTLWRLAGALGVTVGTLTDDEQ